MEWRGVEWSGVEWGGWSTSRMSPPKVLVNIPQIAQQRRGTPARMPFIVPITAKAPTPKVSLHHTHASSSLNPDESAHNLAEQQDDYHIKLRETISVCQRRPLYGTFTCTKVLQRVNVSQSMSRGACVHAGTRDGWRLVQQEERTPLLMVAY